MHTNSAVKQSKIIRWSESPCNQSGGKWKGLCRQGFAEEPSLEFRMKYWASKRRCKRWQWSWWRWWTAMCDRWECRRLSDEARRDQWGDLIKFWALRSMCDSSSHNWLSGNPPPLHVLTSCRIYIKPRLEFCQSSTTLWEADGFRRNTLCLSRKVNTNCHFYMAWPSLPR